MKLIDALKEIESNHNKYAQYRDSYFGYRYMNNNCIPFNCCEMGYMNADKKIVFYDNDLFSEGWVIHTAVKPRYKIGDKFLFSYLRCEIRHNETVFLQKTFYNVIGEITKWDCDDLGKILYTVHFEDIGLDTMLSEEDLEKIDMIVLQSK